MNKMTIRGGDRVKHLYMTFRKQSQRLVDQILSRKNDLLTDLLISEAMRKTLFYEALWKENRDQRVQLWLQNDIERCVRQFEENVKLLEDGNFEGEFNDSVVNDLQEKHNDLTTKYWDDLRLWRGLGELDNNGELYDGFVHDDYDDYDERVHGAIRLA
jgi:hypothetical protein